MKTFFQRTADEQDLIKKAYDFEFKAIQNLNYTKNPYFSAILALENGIDVWEAINEAIKLESL